MHVYVDRFHSMHANGRGNSCFLVTMGKGNTMNASKKLGLNTVSSKKTEVVSNGERFPKCTWFRYFRFSKGGNYKEDTLIQDHKSFFRCIRIVLSRLANDRSTST